MAQIVHTKINVQRKITSILLCQLCFNFLLYHTSKIQPLASNLKLISKILYECIRTFEYFPIWIFVRIIFVSFFWYEYIRIFIRIAFLIRIYSDIRSYHLFDTNIFGYSFVSFFGYKYIRIFVRIENLYSPHPGPDASRKFWRFKGGQKMTFHQRPFSPKKWPKNSYFGEQILHRLTSEGAGIPILKLSVTF